MKTITFLRNSALSLIVLLFSFSALHGQEGKISKYSLAIYGGGFRPEKVNFTSGTRLENNRTFLLGAGIYNHPSERFDVFLRSEFLFHKAEILPTVCNCSSPAVLNSNSTIELGFFYNLMIKNRSEFGIGLSAGIYYDFLNANTISSDYIEVSSTEGFEIRVPYLSSPGIFVSPQMQYNLLINSKFSITASLGLVLSDTEGLTYISVSRWTSGNPNTEPVDFGRYNYNYGFLKLGLLYNFRIMWLKN